MGTKSGSGRLEIRTLGAVAALRDGHDLPLGGAQARLLLVFLMHARGREVGRAGLVEALWGAQPPSRPDVALRALLSRLRSTLGVSLLEGRLPGLVRLPADMRLDVATFEAEVVGAEALLARDDARGALERAHAALELDRGPFAAGLEAEWLEEPRREQLYLRERALEAAAAATLALSEPDSRAFGIQAAGELCSLQPYREQAYLLRMRLLASAGDRAQALATYDELRHRLREELGLVPGPQLRELHRRLVADEGQAGPASAPAPSVRLKLPAPLEQALLDASGTRGRAEPLSAIERHWRSATRSGRLVLVAGEAGVGKTSLVAAAGAAAYDSGAPVLYGRCDPDPLVPYAPFAEALAPAAAAGLLVRLPESSRAYLKLLLPALEDLPEEPLGAPEVAQLRLFQAVQSALASLRTAQHGLVLVLDDLHWADASTLLLVRYLATELQRTPFLILGTMRDPDPDQGELLPAALARLRRRAPLSTVRVPGLDEATVFQLASEWAEAAIPSSLARELGDHTGGNPFYLKALLEHLRATGAFHGDQVPERLAAIALQGAPASVREAVSEQVRRLGEPVAAVLDAAAVLGPQFLAAEAAAVSEVEIGAALRALESASAAGLMHEVGAGTYTFAHALVRTALLDRISAARRALLHVRAGQAIEHGPDDDRRVGELALHFGRALSDEVAPRALRYAKAAGDRAAARYSHAEAAEHYDLALRALAATRHPAPWDRYELLVALGLARFRSSGPASAAEPFREAMRIAEREGDAQRLAVAALGPGLERYLRNSSGVDIEMVEALEQADRALGEDQMQLKARVKTQLLLERTFLDPLQERQARSDELQAVVRRLGDPASRLEAFVARAVALWYPSHSEQLLAELPEMVALADTLHRPDLALHLHCTAFGWALAHGLADELDRCLRGAGDAAEALRTQIHRMRVKALRITRLLLRGELERAQEMIASLVPEARELFPEVAAEVDLIWSFVLARELGGVDALLAKLQAALEVAPAIPVLDAIAAETYVLAGDRDSARAHLAALGRGLHTMHEDFLTLGVLTITGSVAAELGETDTATDVRDRLRPWVGRNTIVGLAAFHRPISLTVGVLEHMLGDAGEALKCLRTAQEEAERMHALPWQADAVYEQGRVLSTAGRDAEARDAFAEAIKIAERYGGTVIAGRARDAIADGVPASTPAATG